MRFKVRSELYMSLPDRVGQFITVQNAVAVIRQRYPHYGVGNLYGRARQIGTDGKPLLEVVRCTLPYGGKERVFIPRPAFEELLKLDKLGSKSAEKRVKS